MAWTLLPTNYTDAVWNGLKKFNMINNSDGTVSFNDMTVYTNKENSFFGSKDANKMNEALNYIMSMLENGTDLYEEFTSYFSTQKIKFEDGANDVIENVRSLTNDQYDSYKTYITNLKSECDSALSTIEQNYNERMSQFESTSKSSFDTWFDTIKGQLSDDVATSLQSQITEVEERLSGLEHMSLQNDYSVPLVVNSNTTPTLLVDDLGYAIVADWKY